MIHIELNEFLKKHVEGYLFGDLEAMSLINASPVTEMGGVCYPMMSACYSGVELFGGLMSKQQYKAYFKRKRSERWLYFKDYWNNCLSGVNPEYRGLLDFFIDSARNPLSHSFITNPYIAVFKNHPELHLKEDSVSRRIYVDVNLFAKDLLKSYKVYVVKAANDKVSSEQMQKNLDSILEETVKEGTNPEETLKLYFKRHKAVSDTAMYTTTQSGMTSIMGKGDTGVGTTLNALPSIMAPEEKQI